MASSLPTRPPHSPDRARGPPRPPGRDAGRGPGAGDPRRGGPGGGPPGGGGGTGARDGGFRPQHNPDRRRMIDLRREGHLKYDLREVLVASTLAPEQVQTFIATVVSKGSRQSTGEAKDWVTQKMNDGALAKPDRDAVNTLLDRYSKWR